MWVNTDSGGYRWYGTTIKGKYTSEREAMAGGRPRCTQRAAARRTRYIGAAVKSMSTRACQRLTGSTVPGHKGGA